MKCRIAGCYHEPLKAHSGLCREHEIDFSYYHAQCISQWGRAPSAKEYVIQKNEELLG